MVLHGLGEEVVGGEQATGCSEREQTGDDPVEHSICAQQSALRSHAALLRDGTGRIPEGIRPVWSFSARQRGLRSSRWRAERCSGVQRGRPAR
ncbi:hypothetical protein GCM10009539_59420 [Cryptosporangium japonicum]|uniref:Uncharacterized protein n=1 Tax=Cryptosporangium japonicum TaxID=80872 RepID=A0ABN0UXY0_9ACTN